MLGSSPSRYRRQHNGLDGLRSGTHSTPRPRYDRHFILRVTARIVLSVALGCAATEGLYLIDKFGPYSSIRDQITDVLTFPGLIIARLFYLVGGHIGSGSSELWWAFFLGNSFFYAVLCYFILDVFH